MQHSPDYWTEVEDVFNAAVDLPAAERAATLADRCAGQPRLRAEVEALLEAHDRGGTMLEPTRAARDDPDAPASGTCVGGWRLLERIGHGGMSDVYRAVRAGGDFTHVVAVKLIRSLADGGELPHRFQAEREVLGALHHPYIVTLIDGGVSPQRQPYLVMELVEGRPITQFAREQRLSLEARLQLFAQVCAAVQHAHQHGVVHRDLKPANILVTADGHAKVLDFGVAKLLGAPGRAAAAEGTRTGLLPAPLTPNYASPEQLRGLPVTTVSDVYTLGVLLHELLSGVRPYETTGQPLDVVLDRVLSHDVRRPSAAQRAEQGSAPLPYPRSMLRGDLDAIVLRAMAREPEHRYASASELADDLLRFRQGQPVLAREPSAGYLIRRFAARHTAAVVAGAIAAAGIVGALSLAIAQAREAERERMRAQQRFTEVRQLANALIHRIHEALVAVPGATTARRAIAEEASRYLERLAQDAGDDAALAVDLARAYRHLGTVQGSPQVSNLGDREAALGNFRKGIALLEPFARKSDPSIELLDESSALQSHLSQALLAMPGRRREAELAAREALAVADRLATMHPRDETAQRVLIDAHFGVAITLFTPEAERYLRIARDRQRLRLSRAPDDADRLLMAAVMNWMLAAHLVAQRRSAEARPDLEETRRLYERYLDTGARGRLGPESRGAALNAIGFAAFHLGDLNPAIDAYRDSVVLRQALAERDGDNALMWPSVAATRVSLARALEAAGRRDEALREVEAGLAIFERTPGSISYLTGTAEAHLRRGRLWLRANGSTPAPACRSLARAVAVYGEAVREERMHPLDGDRLIEARELQGRWCLPAPPRGP